MTMLRAATTAAIVLAALSGCSSDCQQDSDCVGGDVCARDGACLAPTELVSADLTWTIAGAPPTDASCMGLSLRVGFITDDGRSSSEFGFAPIACVEGAFHVDKLPGGFDEIELGYDVDDDFADPEVADPDGGNPVAFALQAY
jgi:hypothetical protein